MKRILLFLFSSFCISWNAQTLVSIKIVPNNPTLGIGTQVKFKAIGFYSDNTSQDISSTVTWSSSNTTVATVSNALGTQGFVTLSNVGSSQISATLGSVTKLSSTTVVNDFDGDGTPDINDNCKYINNVSQIESDMDGIGDDCDCTINISNPTELYATSPQIIVVPSSITTGITNTFYSTVYGGNINPINLTPNYQWYKNGNPVGSNSPTYSDAGLLSTDSIQLKISSGINCAAGNVSSNTIVMSNLATTDFEKENRTVYPNPAKDKIYFKNFKNISKINIYDLSGKLIKSENSKSNSLDISKLKSGNYIIEIINEGKAFTTKITKD